MQEVAAKSADPPAGLNRTLSLWVRLWWSIGAISKAIQCQRDVTALQASLNAKFASDNAKNLVRLIGLLVSELRLLVNCYSYSDYRALSNYNIQAFDSDRLGIDILNGEELPNRILEVMCDKTLK